MREVSVISNFFFKLMEDFGLVDISLIILLSTWSNRRVGADSMYKRLDSVLVSVDLLDYELQFRQWVGCGGVSDHYLVYLQILNNESKL